MGRFQSGQMGRTVNPLSSTSGVRIPPGPPEKIKSSLAIVEIFYVPVGISSFSAKADHLLAVRLAHSSPAPTRKKSNLYWKVGIFCIFWEYGDYPSILAFLTMGIRYLIYFLISLYVRNYCYSLDYSVASVNCFILHTQRFYPYITRYRDCTFPRTFY